MTMRIEPLPFGEAYGREAIDTRTRSIRQGSGSTSEGGSGNRGAVSGRGNVLNVAKVTASESDRVV
jgi:hypothetical protein